MNLENLKSIWPLFKLKNSFEQLTEEEILCIIESAHESENQLVGFSLNPNSILFCLVLIFIQSC